MMATMLHMFPKVAWQAVGETLRVFLVVFPQAWILAIVIFAVLFGILVQLLGGDGTEFAIEVVTVAAPPFMLVQVQLMLVVGFALYLGLISCRNLPAFAPTYISNRILSKILESVRFWMSLIVGEIRIIHSPNMTSSWFAFPDRTTNPGTRYLPGDSPQLE